MTIALARKPGAGSRANRPVSRRRTGRPLGDCEAQRMGKCLRVVPLTEAGWILACDIGERIRACREEQQVSVAELTAAVGLTRTSTVHRWESGGILPTIQRLYQIAQALGIRMSDLLPEEY